MSPRQSTKRALTSSSKSKPKNVAQQEKKANSTRFLEKEEDPPIVVSKLVPLS